MFKKDYCGMMEMKVIAIVNVAAKNEEYCRYTGGQPQLFHEESHGENFLALAQNCFRANGHSGR